MAIREHNYNMVIQLFSDLRPRQHYYKNYIKREAISGHDNSNIKTILFYGDSLT